MRASSQADTLLVSFCCSTPFSDMDMTLKQLFTDFAPIETEY